MSRKLLFRAISCNSDDITRSFSTFEKAYEQLERWAKKYGHSLVEAENIRGNEHSIFEYQINYWGISENGISYEYQILKFNKKEYCGYDDEGEDLGVWIKNISY